MSRMSSVLPSRGTSPTRSSEKNLVVVDAGELPVDRNLVFSPFLRVRTDVSAKGKHASCNPSETCSRINELTWLGRSEN